MNPEGLPKTTPCRGHLRPTIRSTNYISLAHIVSFRDITSTPLTETSWDSWFATTMALWQFRCINLGGCATIVYATDSLKLQLMGVTISRTYGVVGSQVFDFRSLVVPIVTIRDTGSLVQSGTVWSLAPHLPQRDALRRCFRVWPRLNQ